MPRQPPPAPRVERKPESKNVDDILKPPGRDSRPERVSIHSESNNQFLQSLYSDKMLVDIICWDKYTFEEALEISLSQALAKELL